MSPRNTYAVTCQRNGGWWAIDVPGTVVHTEAHRLDQVEATVRDALALLLGVDPDSFDISVQWELPPGSGEVLARLAALRAEVDMARQRARDAAAQTACYLTKALHLNYRDAGSILGLSHQRIDQLVKVPQGEKTGKPAYRPRQEIQVRSSPTDS